MNSPVVYTVSAIGPDNTATIFGTFPSLEEAEAAMVKLAAKMLLYRAWECRRWQTGCVTRPEAKAAP